MAAAGASRAGDRRLPQKNAQAHASRSAHTTPRSIDNQARALPCPPVDAWVWLARVHWVESDRKAVAWSGRPESIEEDGAVR